MTYSAEFIVNTGQFEHVKLTIDGQDFADRFFGKDEDMEVLLGDYQASLRVAVIYGRDHAGDEVTPPTVSHEEKVDLIQTELLGKVVETVEHEDKSADPPWKQVVAQPVHAWEAAGMEDF